MTSEKKPAELYRRHRPTKFTQVLGQAEAVGVLEKFLRKGDMPHVILLSGPSGTGKNTIGRILRRKLGCGDRDYHEVNCGSVESAIDTVRDIERRMMLRPISGECRVWLLDEVQSLSRAKFAQQALLKILEDCPSHVYFLLCTTEPDKLLKTVRGRCTHVRLRALKAKELQQLVRATLLAEGQELDGEVVERIVSLADGSARQALQDLGKVLDLPGKAEQLQYLQDSSVRATAYELARLLVWERGVTWGKVAAIIGGLDDGEDWEMLRRLVLACASKEALKSGSPKAFAIIDAFLCHWYDCGRAGLVLACKSVLDGRK